MRLSLAAAPPRAALNERSIDPSDADMRAWIFLWLCACGPSLEAVRPVARGPGVVISVHRMAHVRGDGPGGVLVEAVVENDSAAPIIVSRDGILLMTPAGARPRVPGGWSHFYSLRPGEHHRVRCIYQVGDLRAGERVALSFTGAITQNGAALPIEPIELVVH
jgi:hypothetical protein